MQSAELLMASPEKQREQKDQINNDGNKLITSKLENDSAFQEWLNSTAGKEMYLKLAGEYPDGIDQLMQLRVHDDPVKIAEHPVPIPGDPYGDFQTDLYNIVNETKEKYLPYDAKIPKNEILRDVLENSVVVEENQQEQQKAESIYVEEPIQQNQQAVARSLSLPEWCVTDEKPPTPPIPTGDPSKDEIQKIEYEKKLLAYQLSQYKCLNQQQEEELQELRNKLQAGQEAIGELKSRLIDAVRDESFETNNELQTMKEKHAEKEAEFLYETSRLQDQLDEKQARIDEMQDNVLKMKKEKNEALLNAQKQADIVQVMERNTNNDIKQLEGTVHSLNQTIRRLEQQKTQLVGQVAMSSGGSTNHFHGNYEQVINMKMALSQKDQQIAELMNQKIDLNRALNRYQTNANINAKYGERGLMNTADKASRDIINDYQNEVEKLRQENLRLLNNNKQRTSGFKHFIDDISSLVGNDVTKQQQLHESTLNMTNMQKIREESNNEIQRLNQIISTLVAINEELKDSCLTCLQSIASFENDETSASMQTLKAKVIEMRKKVNAASNLTGQQ